MAILGDSAATTTIATQKAALDHVAARVKEERAAP
jgi:hypothetical protein